MASYNPNAVNATSASADSSGTTPSNNTGMPPEPPWKPQPKPQTATGSQAIPGSPTTVNSTVAAIADDGRDFDEFDNSPRNLARQARYEREQWERLAKAETVNKDDSLQPCSVPKRFSNAEADAQVEAMEAAAAARAAGSIHILRALVAYPNLARQVAALPIGTTSIVEAGKEPDDNLAVAVLIEVIRQIDGQPEDWIKAIKDGLEKLRREPGTMGNFGFQVVRVIDDMLADNRLESARTEADPIYYATTHTQTWLRERLINCDPDVHAEARLLTSISEISETAIEIIEPQKAGPAMAPFPLTVLSPTARQMVEQVSRSLCLDPAMAALPAIVQLASAIGTTRQIAGKPDWLEFPIIWGGLIAGSGQVKTPMLKKIQAPMKIRQRQLWDKYNTDKKASPWDLPDAELPEALATHVESLDDGPPMRRPDPEPKRGRRPRPVLEHIYTSDFTLEAIGAMLEPSPRGICIATEELTKWLGGVGEYKPNKRGDNGRCLELFDGHPSKIDRRGEKEPLVIKRYAAWVIGGIQPGVFWSALGATGLANGQLSRHLLAMPPVRKHGWSDEIVTAETLDRWAKLNDNLYHFDFDGNGEPRIVTLDDAGRSLLRDYVEANHAEIKNSTDEQVNQMLGKMRGYALKFALLFHCLSQAEREGPEAYSWDFGKGPVGSQDMQKGIELAGWFTIEIRRIYGLKGRMMTVNDDADLWNFILSKGAVTTRDLMKYRQGHYRNATLAREELDLLVASGRGRWANVKMGDAKRATEHFVPDLSPTVKPAG
jgi:hypothetical protein